MQRIYELIRYGIVGVFNAGTYLGLYTVLILVGVPYVLAAIVAFPGPVALGYWLHEHWTFARREPTMRRLGTFLLLQVMALGGSLLLLVILVSGFGVSAILARVITTPLSPVLAYLVSRALVFGRPAEVSAGAARDVAP